MEISRGECSYVVVAMAKVKMTVTVPPDLKGWVDEEVEKGHFADRSHAVQYALMKVRELIKKGEIKF